MSRCLYRTSLLQILSVQHVFSPGLVHVLVINIEVCLLDVGSLHVVMLCNTLYCLCLAPRNGKNVLDSFGIVTSGIICTLILVFHYIYFEYA